MITVSASGKKPGKPADHFKSNTNARYWRLRGEQSRTNASLLLRDSGVLIAQLRPGNGIGEVDDQAVRMG